MRRKTEKLLLDKLYDMGVLSSASKLSAVENGVTVSAFARRRLPVVMTRLRMAEHLRAAVTMIEQGHVRVGTEVVTDPAFLVTRSMEVMPILRGAFPASCKLSTNGLCEIGLLTHTVIGLRHVGSGQQDQAEYYEVQG